MEEALLLKQPADRRLGNTDSLPPGPPGVESDTAEYDTKISSKPLDKEIPKKSSRRRSPSTSPPPRKRTSNRRSPSPRRRRSPSPRRNRFRDYSPRRYDSGRMRRGSPDRRDRRDVRDMRGGGGGYRGDRGRGRSKSRSRSPTPPRRGERGAPWSPAAKKKTMQSAPPPPPSISQSAAPSVPVQAPPPPQYGVLPPQLYADGYANAGYNQYAVPPPQAAYPAPGDAYGMQAPPPAPAFNPAYPPPTTWDAYGQQSWLPPSVADPVQMAPSQPPQIQQPLSNADPLPQQQQPPVQLLPDIVPETVSEPNPTHDAAVAQEAKNQLGELNKQRLSYLKKTGMLKKELKMLRKQRLDLNAGGAPPSPTTKNFIEENEKLQAQIEKKIITIANVIDMLTGIIGEENLDKDPSDEDTTDYESRKVSKPKEHSETAAVAVMSTPAAHGVGSGSERKRKTQKRASSSESSTGSSGSSSSSSESTSSDDSGDSSAERLKTKAIESMKAKQRESALKKEMTSSVVAKAKIEEKKQRFNYVFYDPEMHWCQICNVFPKTAKDFLNHLHSKEHINKENVETPWHIDMINDQYPVYEGAPMKRTPIRGLTFFVPATAWFCKLCSAWMGDLHCASTHLKSQQHSKHYNDFLDKNPNYEVNWLADRQRIINEQKLTQSILQEADAKQAKKNKKDEEKAAKKRKKKDKNADKKDKKKKKRRTKKRKKTAGGASSSESSSSDSSSSESEEQKVQKLKEQKEQIEKKAKVAAAAAVAVKELNNPNPAASIRVAMRKQESLKNGDNDGDDDVPPPPPPMTVGASIKENSGRIGKWTVTQEGIGGASKKSSPPPPPPAVNDEQDEKILQQWNQVQPVISESEKKLLEQLKGKLKNKPREEPAPIVQPASNSIAPRNVLEIAEKDKQRQRNVRRGEDDDRDSKRRRSRSRGPVGGGFGGRRSRSRSLSRGRGVGGAAGFRGRGGRRSRSRSMGRNVRGRRSRSRGWGGGGGARRWRSRSRSRRRSRSYERRRRISKSRSKTRSRSLSRGRVEKPVVRQPEFRPRVPETTKDKKRADSKEREKKEASKKSKSSSGNSSSSAASTNAATAAGKKLPFIGKMPVFKKQSSGQTENGNGASAATCYPQPMPEGNVTGAVMPYPPPSAALMPRPTAAQIQMAMMEDVYGNAPPFHPDVNMAMCDYDDLMPDPVQFVSLMGQAPPPPPPANDKDAPPGEEEANEDGEAVEDMLPPGIDETESEEFVPKPEVRHPREGPLPKEFEEALNIIFPGEKQPGDDDDDDDDEATKKAKASGETQIIVEKPIMQVEDLVKEGIHMVTIDEHSMLGIDEASNRSMNEPLVFNRHNEGQPRHAPPTPPTPPPPAAPAPAPEPTVETIEPTGGSTLTLEDTSSQNAADFDLSIIEPPKPVAIKSSTTAPTIADNVINDCEQPLSVPLPTANGVEKVEIISEVPVEQAQKVFPSEVTAPLDIPMPKTLDEIASAVVYDLDDIPQPPDSPTESEKHRRQEELDDLAMLGIDADDMAAQCI